MSQSITVYRLRDPAMIYDVAARIAAHFPTRPHVVAGIYELLLNAIEHGHLEIDPALKAELLARGTFSTELSRRARLPENDHRYVEIDVIEHTHASFLTIRDRGQGFDWRRHRFDPNSRELRGRGLAIAKNCGFDGLIFNEAGNAVTCIMNVSAEALPDQQLVASGW